jgi:hypothetical protein
MTDTTHTPGPWTYGYEPTLNRHVVRAGFAGERSICVSYGAGLKTYEAAANARLIAAAPEMLEALRAVADYWAGGDVPPAIDAAMRAAIAKATGQEPG